MEIILDKIIGKDIYTYIDEDGQLYAKYTATAIDTKGNEYDFIIHKMAMDDWFIENYRETTVDLNGRTTLKHQIYVGKDNAFFELIPKDSPYKKDLIGRIPSYMIR